MGASTNGDTGLWWGGLCQAPLDPLYSITFPKPLNLLGFLVLVSFNLSFPLTGAKQRPPEKEEAALGGGERDPAPSIPTASPNQL